MEKSHFRWTNFWGAGHLDLPARFKDFGEYGLLCSDFVTNAIIGIAFCRLSDARFLHPDFECGALYVIWQSTDI